MPVPHHHPFRFGVVAAQAASGEQWVALARRTEALGYATLLTPDTLGQTLAPLPALAVAAAATTSLHVGTYVLANDYRNPVLVAREAATLDFLSGGRFELGLGAGRPTAAADYRQLGMTLESGGTRVARLAESVAIIKPLLSGDEVNAPGSHYATAGAAIYPRPAQPPPLLVAASGKRLLALAAREADIVALGVRPDASEAEVRAKIAWLREAAGDRFDHLVLNLNLMAVGERLHPQMLARFGLDPASLAGSDAPSLLLGTPDEMRDKLLARRDALGVSYYAVGEAFMEALAPVVAQLAGR